jgi:hypothetical protein
MGLVGWVGKDRRALGKVRCEIDKGFVELKDWKKHIDGTLRIVKSISRF